MAKRVNTYSDVTGRISSDSLERRTVTAQLHLPVCAIGDIPLHCHQKKTREFIHNSV